ncbi:trypsin-like peptidase domain-containing protein [candidate division KSB1 bacterium]|nr:trypsin-like peptidase domain-containing protein [candidate division KSB1 bacterium]
MLKIKYKYLSKRRGIILLIALILISNIYGGEILEQLETELSNLIEVAKPSVVTIASTITYSYIENSKISQIPFWDEESNRQTYQFRNIGSGLILDHEGHIITRSNAIQQAENIEVILSNQKRARASFIGIDYETGLAVIQINEKPLIPARLGNETGIKVGKWIAVMGNSMGVSPSISLGLINGIRQENELIQLSAFINPGNSGSPVFNIKGEVIGIVAARMNSGEVQLGTQNDIQLYEGGIAYPITLIKKIVKRLIDEKNKKKPWFGISTTDVPGEKKGVLITSIILGSPAYKAGLKADDLVTRVNGKSILNPMELIQMMEQAQPGSSFEITIERAQKSHNFTVVLEEKPTQIATLTSIVSTTYMSSSSITATVPGSYQPKENELLLSRLKKLEEEIIEIKAQLKR